MKEPGNPIAAIFFTVAFICAMAAAVCAVAIDNPILGGVLFGVLFLASLGLLIAGLVVRWRTRKKQYEFIEPTKPVPKFLLAAFRIGAGLILTVSGCFMLWISIARLFRGEGLPIVGFLMSFALVGFGLKGLLAGIKKRPNQPPEPTTTAVTTPAAQEPRHP